MEDIQWKVIEGYEEYSISNIGQIKNNITGKLLKPDTDKDGYRTVQVGKYSRSRIKRLKMHRIVALAWIPNPDNKPQVNHIDANKQNNNVSNLEWATNKENITHSFVNNFRTALRGEANGAAILTASDVIALREDRIKYGMSSVELSAKYGVARTTAQNICARRCWKHV